MPAAAEDERLLQGDHLAAAPPAASPCGGGAGWEGRENLLPGALFTYTHSCERGVSPAGASCELPGESRAGALPSGAGEESRGRA